MGKILVWLRVSTETQELVNQKNEMRDFVKSMGYAENDIIYIEGKGASAIQINDEYIEMYEEVKNYIEDSQISAVAVWAVNRLARDEEWFVKFKKMFIENRVNFIVKNPTLSLLNPDGSVNAGAELALSLFSTMAKQEMEERKAKFSRTKRAYAKQGKWSGGRTKKFGYKIDENNFFVEDENDGEIVRTAFQLYSTGQYSSESLAKEMNDRGYKRNDGVKINYRFLVKIIKSASYCGEPDEKNNMRVYPPIITKELYDKCREVAEKNKIEMRTGERIVLASKLLKCHICGGTYTSNSRHFACCQNIHNNCENNLKIRQCVVDNIIWRIAFQEHMDYLLEISKNNTDKYNEQIEVIDKKLVSFKSKIEESETKKSRIIDTYLEGYIDKKTRDLRLAKVSDDTLAYKKEINALEEERKGILGLMADVDKDLEELKWLNALDVIESSVKTDKDRYDIIHKHILKIVPERMSFGKRDPRTTRDNGVLFNIYTISGKHHKYLFIPKFYKGHNLYIYNEVIDDYIPDMVEITDNNYVRKS